MTTMIFTVIIPTLNEEKNIRKCIRSIRLADANAEIIVVDGGSVDATRDIVVEEDTSLCTSVRGRGMQLNRGAASARGEILIFLHADTLMSPNAFDVFRRIFSNPNVEIGTCRLQFDTKHPLLRFYSFCARLDSVFTTFGDQCIVVRRSFFEGMGGFPDWPLFEDVALLQSARRRSRIYSLPTTVFTSARAFVRNGIVRQQLRNAGLLARYLMGVSPHRLATIYAQNGNKTSLRGEQIIHKPIERSEPLCEHSIEWR